jgi:hypothetical protein
MPGGRKRLPKRTCPSLYGGRGEQELDVEEQAGREEEPACSRLSGIHPGYSCKEGRIVEDGLLVEFPCTPTRTPAL